MSERKRGIVCAYCGMAWGYEGETPTPELIKEACDHEAVCVKNPYTAQIRNLKRERDEAREKAERYRLEANAMMLQRDEAREENKKFREALEWIAKQYDDSKPTHAVAMDAYEMSCTAKASLRKEGAK